MTEPYPLAAGAALSRPGIVAERFRREKDAVIEEGLGKQPSWAIKVGNSQSGVLVDDIDKLLEILGLKAVDKSKVCVDRDVLQAWKTIATAAMSEPAKLNWEDE